MRDVDAAGTDEEGLAPGTGERGNVGGVGDDGGFQAVEGSKTDWRDGEGFLGYGAASDGTRDGLAQRVSVINRTEGDFGAGCVGNYVGGAAAGDYADVEGASAHEL